MKNLSNEEMAKEIAKYCSVMPPTTITQTDILAMTNNAAMQAMEWKDEIIKKTLESSVSAEVGYFNQRGLSIYFDKSLEKLGFEEGDKVKVLIVKEDKL